MEKNEPNYERYLFIGIVFTLLIAAGFSYYWLSEPTRLTQAAESFSIERVHRGGEVYIDQCASCHGAEGEGGIGPALNDRDLLRNTLDEIFFSVIRSGVPGTEMPGWSVDFGGPLTDEDIRDVVAFIRSWEPTAPVIEPVVFEPDSARGALLYTITCAVCHGERGAGTDKAPALNDADRLKSLDNDWYRATIRNGRPARGMPTWGTVLSPNQIEDIISLIDAWREGKRVEAAFSVTDLIDSAIFSLEEDDPESAAIHLTRALTVAEGAGAEILRNAATQLAGGSDAGALATLIILQEEWPIGDSENGQVIYAEKCGVCHGGEGEGGIGSPMQSSEFIQGSSNADLVKFISEGRAGTAMAGFKGRLTLDEIADVIAFLRTLQE